MMPNASGKPSRKEWLGSRTLLRGLDVLEAVIAGQSSLATLAQALDLNRSTVHRLAQALVDRRYITFLPRVGYGAGPKLLEIGYRAQSQMKIAHVARNHVERLASNTGHAVHLGIPDDGKVLCLDKVAGQCRLEIKSHIGERTALQSTVLGKSLLLDDTDARLLEVHRNAHKDVPARSSMVVWLCKMREFRALGYAYDHAENGDPITSVAAPIRDATGRICGAISVSGAAHYMDDKRMAALAMDVRRVAEDISRDLGWEGVMPPKSRRRSGYLGAAVRT